MQHEFYSVEAELRDIEADFSSGRMNAFGNATTQDAFLRELKRIAEVETQVFYKTCTILKSSNEAEHSMLTTMFASAHPPSQGRGAGKNSSAGAGAASAGASGGGSGIVGNGSGAPLSYDSTLRGDGTGRGLNSTPGSATLDTSMPGVSASNLFRSQSPGASRVLYSQPRWQQGTPGPGGDGKGGTGTSSFGGSAPPLRATDWGNEMGFSDKAFDDVAAHFCALEEEFAALGDNLRQISKHVMQLNDMSEQVNNLAAGGEQQHSPDSGKPETPTFWS